MLDEIDRVGQRRQDPIFRRAVDTIKNLVGKAVGRLVAAPDIGVGEEEDLLGSEALQSGQLPFATVGGYIVLVGPEGFSQAPIVSNVFPLGSASVNLFEVNNINCNEFD